MQDYSDSKKCPYCAELIKPEAIKCRYCGEMLVDRPSAAHERPAAAPQPQYSQQVRSQKWNPGIAALISFIIPGGGQMYKGDVGNGIIWFIMVIIGYVMLIVPGLILHLICVINAASGDPYRD